jgi:hypothetical protein
MSVLPNGQLRTKTGYLPNEVLSIIFLHCLDEDEHDCVEPKPLEAPLNVSQVCRLWREIALATHRLWTGISFTRQQERIFDNIALLNLWIERSAHLPLGIRLTPSVEEGYVFTFETDDNPDQSHLKGVREFVDSALKCAHRWRVLDVIVPEVPYATPLVRALPGCKTIQHFGVSAKYLGLYETPIYYDFSPNTDLQSVRFVTPLIRPVAPAANPAQALSSLVSLELHFCPSFQNCLAWIDLCPNLVLLTVRFFITEDRAEPTRAGPLSPTWASANTGVLGAFDPALFHRPGGPFGAVRTLPRLIEFELTFLASTMRVNPGLFLNALSAPQLMHFELDLNYMYFPEDLTESWPHAAEFLQRSDSSLTSLILSGTPLKPADFVECLKMCPELMRLSVDTVSDEVLHVLTPRLNGPESGFSVDVSGGPLGGSLTPTLELPNHLEWQRQKEANQESGPNAEAMDAYREYLFASLDMGENSAPEDDLASESSAISPGVHSSEPSDTNSSLSPSSPSPSSCSCLSTAPSPPARIETADDSTDTDQEKGEEVNQGEKPKAEDEKEEEEDTTPYTLLCPDLSYFEIDDVDGCTLKSLYALMRSRCEDILPGIAEFVADENKKTMGPMPNKFKTLDALVLPYDALYEMLSHPEIVKRMENVLYF